MFFEKFWLFIKSDCFLLLLLTLIVSFKLNAHLFVITIDFDIFVPVHSGVAAKLISFGYRMLWSTKCASAIVCHIVLALSINCYLLINFSPLFLTDPLRIPIFFKILVCIGICCISKCFGKTWLYRNVRFLLFQEKFCLLLLQANLILLNFIMSLHGKLGNSVIYL